MAFESGRVPQETQDYLASKARSKNSEVAAAVLVALLTCMLIVSIFIKSGDAKKVGATHEALIKSDAPVLPYKPKELVPRPQVPWPRETFKTFWTQFRNFERSTANGPRLRACSIELIGNYS